MGHRTNIPSEIDFVEGDLSESSTYETLRMVDYATRASASKLVYASSMSVYGDVPDSAIAEDQVPRPLSCYGVGKLAAEQYLKIFAKKMPSLSFRMFNVYGPGQDMTNLRQGMISIYVSQALASNHIVVKGSFDRFRDFVYIDDVVDAWGVTPDDHGCARRESRYWRTHDGARRAGHDRGCDARRDDRTERPDTW